ncbi:MAG: VOC family protein [Myxococcota bacterium]
MSISINPYLTLDGNCEEAMKFWGDILNIKPEIMRMGDSPMEVPPEAKNRVMHSTLKADGFVLMASDSMLGQPVGKGGPVSLSLNFTTTEEQTRVWNRLAEGGTVTMPLGDMFWGRFGMLVDKFGIKWMLNHQPPQK